MNQKSTTLFFVSLLIVAISFSCTRIHKEVEFDLEEFGLKLILPANSILEYDAPSHSGDNSGYQISYNDGNSSHSSVQATFDKVRLKMPISLPQLIEQIEKEGGVILEQYTYPNGFMGCSYQKEGNKLYQFIKTNQNNETYIILPNEIYNNQHKYLEVILKAIASIEFAGV